MKTPKRKYYFYESGINPDNGDIIMDMLTPGLYEARWKRKNKIAQLKRTIARLSDEGRQFRELWRGEHLKDYNPEWEAFMILRRLKTPAEDAALDEKFEYWINLRKVGELALNAACLASKAYGEAKGKEDAACQPEPAKSGQQDCIAQTAENLTERRGN